MANHIWYNKSTEYGQLLTNVLKLTKQADSALDDLRDTMIQMRDADGTQDADYALIATRFGFETTAAARAAFDLVDAVYQRIVVNTSVTQVRASRANVISRLR